MAREARLVQAFVDLADTLVQGFDVLDFLDGLCRCSVEVLDTAAAGVLLATEQRELRLVAASEEKTRVLEAFEVQHHEGPCLDAYRAAAQVATPDLTAAAGRWPRFTEKALDAGFRSAFSFPLRLRTECIGAMNLFLAEPGPLSDADQATAQALADVAAIGLIQERALREARGLSEQLQHALVSRVVIEQAKGVVATALGVTMDEAFLRLRRRSMDTNRPLHAVAQEVTAGTLSPRHLGDARK